MAKVQIIYAASKSNLFILSQNIRWSTGSTHFARIQDKNSMNTLFYLIFKKNNSYLNWQTRIGFKTRFNIFKISNKLINYTQEFGLNKFNYRLTNVNAFVLLPCFTQSQTILASKRFGLNSFKINIHCLMLKILTLHKQGARSTTVNGLAETVPRVETRINYNNQWHMNVYKHTYTHTQHACTQLRMRVSVWVYMRVGAWTFGKSNLKRSWRHFESLDTLSWLNVIYDIVYLLEYTCQEYVFIFY